MIAVPLQTLYLTDDHCGHPKPSWLVYSEICYYILIFLHTGHGLWIVFWIKLYTALFNVIGSALELLCSGTDEDQSPDTSVEKQLMSQLRECYKLFIRVEDQVKNFNNYFGTFIVCDGLYSILSLIVFLYFLVRWILLANFVSASVLAFGFVVFTMNVYNLATGGSRLTFASSVVLDHLHKLNAAKGERFDFELRQEMQMFVLLISSNSPKVDAAQYFTLNRNLIIAVNVSSCQ